MQLSNSIYFSFNSYVQIMEPGIATGFWLDDRGVGVRASVESRILSTLSRAHQWVTGALSPGINRPRREADHSSTVSAEVKKTWIYTPTPQTPS
jgi:hypothetical protein